MKIFLSILYISLSTTSAFGDFVVEHSSARSCNDKANEAPSTTVILAMSDDDLGAAGVTGASTDIKKMREISYNLYANSNIEIMKPMNIELQAKNIKERALFRFKQLKAKQEASGGGAIHLMYSGHGALCTDPITNKEHWCISAGIDTQPIKEDQWKNLSTYDQNQYLVIGGEYVRKEFNITEEEIMNTLHPKTMFLDSCHSGKVADMLINQKNKIANQEGVFVFAASMSHQQAIGNNGGGAMTSTVYNFVQGMNADVACMMDWEGNGEISDRAISVATMLAFTAETTHVSGVNLKNPGTHERGSNTAETHDRTQMISSNPVGKCFMKHKFKCPEKIKKPEKPKNLSQCEDLTLNFLNISENINNMIAKKDIFRNYLPAFFRPSTELRASNQDRGLQVTTSPKPECNSQATRGLARTSNCPEAVVINECNSQSTRGLARTKNCGQADGSAAMAFLTRFKNDIITNYNNVCSKNNQETNCSKFSQESALKILDGLVDNMQEVLYRQTVIEKKK